ncbi:MAG TPA: class I SAM-dependent methyltransferase [Acidimicrobiales bacterium]|nr:class I SAM-dependent methyltransferase [Acidimicrobiales bacterium]
MTDGETTARQYDAMADAYTADNAVNAYNSLYERPSTISLLGRVAGSRVLEVGCGGGELTSWLVEQGATVTAVDVSPRMVELARSRTNGAATVLLADVAEPLAFAGDDSFDLVVASLVLHYIRDWVPVLTEFRRVLHERGAVVFSTHHPAMDWLLHSADDYFAVKQVSERWDKGGRDYDVTFWRRPLTEICAAVAAAGFLIERLVEPPPPPALAEVDPDSYRRIATEPAFLFFRLLPA